jgi:TRAP-type C4-dicarboxylate transport system permease small subunit
LDGSAILGLVLGAAIGLIYCGWQLWDLRRQKQASPTGNPVALAPGAAVRLVFVGVAWWLAFRFTDADKWWLTGSLVVTYSLPLVWQVRKLFPPQGGKS